MAYPRIKQTLDCILGAGVVLGTGGMVLAVTIQALARLLLPSAPAWTEEAARFCFVYSVAFGAGLAIRDRLFVRVDSLVRILGPRAAAVLQLVTHLVIAVLMLVVGAFSVRFVALGLGQRSPCLGIPMAWIHASVLLLSLMTATYAGLEVARIVQGRGRRGTAT